MLQQALLFKSLTFSWLSAFLEYHLDVEDIIFAEGGLE